MCSTLEAQRRSLHDVYLVSAVRTPLGAFLGQLSSASATDLGAAAVRAAVKRAGVPPAAVVSAP